MYEDVITLLARDESESLFCVEKLHCSLCHEYSILGVTDRPIRSAHYQKLYSPESTARSVGPIGVFWFFEGPRTSEMCRRCTPSTPESRPGARTHPRGRDKALRTRHRVATTGSFQERKRNLVVLPSPRQHPTTTRESFRTAIKAFSLARRVDRTIGKDPRPFTMIRPTRVKFDRSRGRRGARSHPLLS